MRVEAVQATTADGLTLRGELVRGGEAWAVLVHDVGEDIDAWQPLRPGLVHFGCTTLALDLRGHGGSDGEWRPARAELDVDLAVTYARRLGARHVCVVAAGLGGILALQALERALPEEGFDLPDSLVLLSPGPLAGIDPMSLRGGGLSRLFLYGAGDPLAPDVLALQRATVGWNVAVSFATAARGTALAAEWLPNVRDKILSFLKEQVTLPGPGRARAERRAAARAGPGV
jgi:pimeloyl-ACP methyl ester carboxylesterase